MKVAILIPTKNRPDFIERLINYYNSLKSIHPLYIGDASNAKISTQILSFIKQCNDVEINYFHWEDLQVPQTIVQLAREAHEKCHYCAFHGDDDYFVPSSLTLCADFLSKHPEYRTAQGRSALFTLDRDGPFGLIRGLGDYWGVNAIQEETSVERLKFFSENYFVTQFSTHRTTEFLQDSQYYANIRDGCLSELLHCFTFAIKGKSKFLDCLYLIRNAHDSINHPDFFEYITNRQWASEYHITIEALAFAVHETSHLALDDAKLLVSQVLKKCLIKSVASKMKNHRYGFLNKYKNFIPMPFKGFLKSLIFNSYDMRILRSKSSCFYDNFLPVLQSIDNNRQKIHLNPQLKKQKLL